VPSPPLRRQTSGSNRRAEDGESELIRNEEMTMYDRRVRKDRENERRKYILPVPVNSVNIRLDERFGHRQRGARASLTDSPLLPESQFKIHSMFNSIS
jgi:hypothetical protein